MSTEISSCLTVEMFIDGYLSISKRIKGGTWDMFDSKTNKKVRFNKKIMQKLYLAFN